MVVVTAAAAALALGALPAAASTDRLTGSPRHDRDLRLDAGDRDPDRALTRLDQAQDALESQEALEGVGPRSRMIRNLRLVGRGKRLLPEATTDVWEHDRYAYLGTFNNPCGDGTGANGSGIPVFDVRKAKHVREVARIPSVAGSRINDVKVFDATDGTSILVHSNEPCGEGGPGGFRVYNVDDPTSPVLLASVQTDDPNEVIRETDGAVDVGVHNLFLFSRGGRDYVGAVVESVFGNFQVFDITDPAAPSRVLTFGAESVQFPDVDFETVSDEDTIIAAEEYLFSGYGSSANRFLHDIYVTPNGRTAYLASWDAGLIRLDLSDLDAPRVLSVALDPENGSPGDGEVNSHAVWPTRSGRYVVETEEDFDALETLAPLSNFTFGEWDTNTIPGVGVSTVAGDAFEGSQTGNTVVVTADAVEVTAGPLAGTTFPATEGAGNQPKLADTGPVNAAAVWAGQACDTDQLLNETDLEGAVAAVRRGACTFAEKLANVAGAGAVAIVVANNLRTDTPWGGVRIWDYRDPAEPKLVSTFDTTCSADPKDPSCAPGGTYTVHNVVVRGMKAYLSWYSEGVLVLDISRPAQPRLVARYSDSSPAFQEQNGGPQDVWGIYLAQGSRRIYASDRNGGLYVLQQGGHGEHGGDGRKEGAARRT